MEIESGTGVALSTRLTTEPITIGCHKQSAAAEKWAAGEESPAYLVWEDLTVVLPKFGNGPTKTLLQGLNGYAEPGKIMAIMGPSGSGKSTLLDSLAGRLAKNTVFSGKVLVNGKKRRMANGVVAYVTQENVLMGTLTVRETVTYSAHLRLSTQMSAEERREVVETTLMEMGLQDCAERQIGNWHIRGISGGEKKRLSIALEILSRPRLLFLDEPTSGLDSASVLFVLHTLRNLARGGRTIVSSVHQPSSEVFALFDDLFLLSGGEAVYFGDTKSATHFFSKAGFPCPSRRNPSDHFLRCVNTDFDLVTATLRGSQRIIETETTDPLIKLSSAEIKTILVEKYRSSDYAAMAKRRLQEISLIEGLIVEGSKQSEVSWWLQLRILTRRSLMNMSRDLGYYWLRVIIYILASLCLGTIYFDIGYSYTAILARVSCEGFISGFMTFMSIGCFPSFIEDMKVFYRERSNGHYGVAMFVLANFLSSFPFLVMVCISPAAITYYMVKFHPGFSHLLYLFLNLFGSIAVIESLMMIIAAIVPNIMMAVVTGAGIIEILIMAAGFSHDLPKPFWRYPISYISFSSWSLQGQYKNDMVGMMFDPMVPGDPKLRGEDLIKNVFRISLHHSKWWDLLAIYLILIMYRVLFFLILKFHERVMPVVWEWHTHKFLQIIYKKPTLKRRSSLNNRPSLHLLAS